MGCGSVKDVLKMHKNNQKTTKDQAIQTSIENDQIIPNPSKLSRVEIIKS
jgi:hypothetical protein